MSFLGVLQKVTAALDKAGVAYMLTGSFAGAYYGSPRSTQDIDLVIVATPAQLRALIGSLPTGEYYADLQAALEAHKHESMFNVIDLESGWKIDLIIRKSRAFSQEEFGRRQLVTVQGASLFVASAEDVVIAKLEWAKQAHSQRQLEDVASILKIQQGSLDRLYLDRWIRELDLANLWTTALEIAEISDLEDRIED